MSLNTSLVVPLGLSVGSGITGPPYQTNWVKMAGSGRYWQAVVPLGFHTAATGPEWQGVAGTVRQWYH